MFFTDSYNFFCLEKYILLLVLLSVLCHFQLNLEVESVKSDCFF